MQINERKLTYLFYTLPFHHRLKISCDLDLIYKDDENISNLELFERILERVKEQNKHDILYNAIKEKFWVISEL